MFYVQMKSDIIRQAATVKIAQATKNLKQNLRSKSSAGRRQQHPYVQLVVITDNTTYHLSLKCTQSIFFIDRLPLNALHYTLSYPTTID